MLNITFSENQRDLASTIQRDLQSSPVKFSRVYNIILVDAISVADEDIQQAALKSQQKGEQLVACILENVAVPTWLNDALIVEMQGGYRARKLNATLRHAEVGEQVVNRNNTFLLAIGGVAILVFSIAIISIANGTVTFPVAEYATENAANQALIDSFLEPTLNAFQPRTTQDAQNFPATVDAAQTRVAPFLVQTATALPQSVNATLSAIETSAAATIAATTTPD